MWIPKYFTDYFYLDGSESVLVCIDLKCSPMFRDVSVSQITPRFNVFFGQVTLETSRCYQHIHIILDLLIHPHVIRTEFYI